MEFDSLLRNDSKAYDDSRELLEKKVARFLKQQASLKTTANQAILTIPVVVHVLHTNTSGAIGGTNISDEKIYSQIAVLNEDFRKLNADTILTRSMFKSVSADTRIKFCLATVDPFGNPTTGITRQYTDKGCFSAISGNVIAGIISWPTDQYLNLWVVDLCGNSLQGFAQLPSGSSQPGLPSSSSYASDGVFVDYLYFGTIGSPDPYDLGRPCVHEVGHWLGLLHPWQGNGCGSTDYVNDTPIQNAPTYNCPNNNTPCSQVTMYENFMGYDKDGCMNLFTQGQVDRIWAVLNSSPRRKALFSSPGCCGSVCTLPYYETFETEGNGFAGCEWEAEDEEWLKSGNGGFGTSDSSLKVIKSGLLTSDTNTFFTPGLDFNNTPSSVLQFDLAYAGDGTSNTDTLTISYSLGCGESWQTIKKLFGNTIKSTKRTSNNSYEPFSNEWKKVAINLPPGLSNRIVTFRFQNITKKDNPIYIDNINVLKQNPVLHVSLYPNPVENNKTSLDVIYEGYKDVTIEVFSTSGVLVHSQSYTNVPSNIYTVNTNDMARGIYLVRVTVENEVDVKKFIKD